MTSKEDMGNLWRFGIEPIKDETLRTLLVAFLVDVGPAGFYTGDGRFLKNVWKRCRLVPKLALGYPDIVGPDRTVDPEALDVALAATVISDSFIWSVEGTRNRDAHARLAAEAWNAHVIAHDHELHCLCARTLNAVLWHHGVFSTCWTPNVKLSGEILLVHMADLVLARTDSE